METKRSPLSKLHNTEWLLCEVCEQRLSERNQQEAAVERISYFVCSLCGKNLCVRHGYLVGVPKNATNKEITILYESLRCKHEVRGIVCTFCAEKHPLPEIARKILDAKLRRQEHHPSRKFHQLIRNLGKDV